MAPSDTSWKFLHWSNLQKCEKVPFLPIFRVQTVKKKVRGRRSDNFEAITSVMAFPQILEPLQCKIVFNRYLGIGRSNTKKSKKQGAFYFEFCFWEDLPHPVNRSPTHSTGPQTPFPTDISLSVAQIRKFQKTRCIFFNFASGRTLLTQSTGPQPIQPVPKHRFLQISRYRLLK